MFEPISRNDLTEQEHKRSVESLIFLVQKQSGKIKANTFVNGSMKREYIDRDDAASPMAASDAIIITGVIEAKQVRYAIIKDVTNAFVKTTVPQDKGDKRIIMKIQGALVDILREISLKFTNHM